MPADRGFRRWVRLPWRSTSRVRRDIDDEFQFHLDMRVAELAAGGATRDAARAEAMRRFGDIRDAREYCRVMDERTIHEAQRRDWFAELGSDVRFALRQMRRSPAFTTLAVLTLALGIGATTAIFSVVHRLMLDPIPYPDGDRIVNLNRSNLQGNLYVTPTPALVDAWRKSARSLESIATFGWKDVVVAGPDEPEEMKAGTLSSSLLGVLGVKPVLGRGILPEDTKVGAPKVVVLGYGVWQRRFGGSSGALDKSLTIDGAPYTVVGVMPRDFRVPFMDGGARQLWLPLEDNPDALGAQALAKVRPGVGRDRLNRELTAVMAALGTERPEFKEWKALALHPQDYLGRTRDTLLVLLAAVGMVLLIACANVANLLLARASARDREFAIRAALGAGRWRIVRQLLTESTLLAVAGGALGVLVASRGLALIIALRPEGLAELDEVRLSSTVLLVSFGLTMFTGVLFGLAPAMFAAARDIGDTLKSATRPAAGHAGARRFRSVLVIAEVSLSVLLLVGAGLLVRTMVKMQHAEIGFEPDGIMSARIQLPETRYAKREQRRDVFDRILDRVHAVPGMADATWAIGVPPNTGITFGDLQIEGRTFKQNERVSTLWSQFATPEYFHLMRLPILAGRPFDRDTADQQVMVNETMATRYWGTAPGAVGRRFRLDAKGPWSTVVGVVRDVTIPSTGRKKGGVRDLQVYFPFATDFESATLLVHGSSAAPDLGRRLSREVRAIDATIRVRDVSSVESLLSRELAGPRFNMLLLVVFAGLALVLATVGLYGVIAYSVSQRTREMGIRLALGAGRPAVLRLVMSQGARLTIAGVVVGLLGAAAVTRWMASMLYGVNAFDPLTFGVVGLVLGLVAVVATYFPARRATRVDPVVALRAE